MSGRWQTVSRQRQLAHAFPCQGKVQGNKSPGHFHLVTRFASPVTRKRASGKNLKNDSPTPSRQFTLIFKGQLKQLETFLKYLAFDIHPDGPHGQLEIQYRCKVQHGVRHSNIPTGDFGQKYGYPPHRATHFLSHRKTERVRYSPGETARGHSHLEVIETTHCGENLDSAGQFRIFSVLRIAGRGEAEPDATSCAWW